jgi:hypothetical protein
MKSVAGIFRTRAEAEAAVQELLSLGIPRDHVTFLAPGAPESEIHRVPTDEGERPGMGTAVGAVVGGAVGAAGAMPLGAALLSTVIPGIGPVIAAGILGGAILGLGGAAVGSALETTLGEGLPKDDLFVYEEALRRGRSVVIAFLDEDPPAAAARAVLERAGAESIDAAREQWWAGVRDTERRSHAGTITEFDRDEPAFRCGFEAALARDVRGQSWDVALPSLRARHPDVHREPAFRWGYERGQAYCRQLEQVSTPPLRKSA